MCTAITYRTKDHYFGRSLDYEFSYAEEVTVTPRNFKFDFRHVDSILTHYALIGMATIINDYPLYYDATNEHGLSMAGLNFPGNAVYKPLTAANNIYNISPFEFIPFVLGQCKTADEARSVIERINLCDTAFSKELPLSPLHWMISDKDKSIVVEAMADGIHVHDDPVGVMTNNPPFNYQLFNLNNYMALSREQPENAFAPELSLSKYSRGMGGMGLPGDLSSMSRFVRVAFTKMNSVSGDSESESISQFFHILGSVEQTRGLVHQGNDQYEITIYSSCCNTDKGIYYYTTYENSQISGVDMHKTDLDSSELSRYPLIKGQQIRMQN